MRSSSHRIALALALSTTLAAPALRAAGKPPKVDKTPPVIKHAPLAKVEPGKDAVLEVEVSDEVGVARVTAHFRGRGGTAFQALALQPAAAPAAKDAKGGKPAKGSKDAKGVKYTGTLTAGTFRGPLDYYLEAADAAGNVARSGSAEQPIKAPSTSTDTEPPKFTEVPAAPAVPGSELTLAVQIEDPSGVLDPKAFFRFEGDADYTPLPLTPVAPPRFEAKLPVPTAQRALQHYFSASDGEANGPSSLGSPESPLVVPVSLPPAVLVPVEPAPRRLSLPAVGTAGVGVVAAVVGAVLYRGALATVDQLDAKYVVGEGRSVADADATRSAQGQSRIGSGLMIGGGLALAGGLVWALWPSSPAPAAPEPAPATPEPSPAPAPAPVAAEPAPAPEPSTAPAAPGN